MKPLRFWFSLIFVGLAFSITWPAFSQTNRIIISGADSVRDSVMTTTDSTMPLTLASRFIMQYVDGQQDVAMNYPIALINDTAPPQLGQPTIKRLNSQSVMISWTSDELATTALSYGEATGVYAQVVSQTLYLQSHQITLTNLTANLTYFFTLSGLDRSGNGQTSQEYQITAQQITPTVTPTTVITTIPTVTKATVTPNPTVINITATPSPTVINVTVTPSSTAINPTATTMPMPLNPITLTVSSGVDSRRLDWNPLNDITVVGYQINRAISGTLNFATLTMVTDTRYYDTQPLVAGQAYCYRVTAIGPNQIALMTSNLVCATVGELELWIPDIVVGSNQSTVIVPINIRNARGLRIGSADIWVTFKQNVISATETLSPTALTERGYSFNYGLTQNELIRIVTTSGKPPELYGSGSLFWAVFEVRGQKGDITPLTLQDFIPPSGGTILSDENFLPIPLRVHHGSLRIGDNCSLGDINCDTVIDARDAGIALKLAAENPTPADERLTLGDINGNGVIDAGDSAMILYYAANKVWPQVGQIPTPRQATAPIVVEVGQAQGRAGQLISLTVKASNLVDWSGGEFTLAYDTHVVQSITQVEPTGLAASFNGLRYLANGNGLLKVAMSTHKPISGNGTLMMITLKLAANLPANSTSPINLSEVRLYDVTGRDFSTSALQRQLERVNGQLTVNPTVPIYLPLLRR